MRSHPVFAGLAWHDDHELADLLGSPVVSRRLVHEWPLSRTDELVLDDGRRLAYKTQLPPSVESAFYAGVRSPLLTPWRDLGEVGRARALVTEWIDAPTLASVPDAELPVRAEEVARAIGAIDGAAPHHLDISTAAAWGAVGGTTLDRLRSLVRDGRYPDIAPDEVDAVAAWIAEPATVDAAASGNGIAHGDLTAEEVFAVEGGWRVIDWQRPVRGPWQLDLVGLLRDRGAPIARDLVIFDGLAAFLLIHWAVLAQTELLPGLPPGLTQSWVRSAIDRILPADA